MRYVALALSLLIAVAMPVAPGAAGSAAECQGQPATVTPLAVTGGD